MDAGTPAPAATPPLDEILRHEDYVRQRIAPAPRDIEYLLHLDLRDAVVHLCRDLRGRLLDYGSGGAPYRRILPQFTPYICADLAATDGIDLAFDAAGNLPSEADGSYDVVFSTQVLEHVPDPARYLREAFRLLRPGGALVLTTHGFFPEHGCPYDFHRWTGYGLEREVAQAGFVVEESYKLTVGLRAALYLFSFAVIYDFRWPSGDFLNGLFRVARSAHFRFGIWLLNKIGDQTSHQSRVESHDEKEHMFLGVALRARKAAAENPH